MTGDPKRLTHVDDGPLGDMLRAARHDGLDADSVARVRAGLAAAGVVAAVSLSGAGTAASVGAASGAGSASAAAGGAAKWGGGILAKLLASSVAVKVGVAAAVVVCAAGASVTVAQSVMVHQSRNTAVSPQSMPTGLRASRGAPAEPVHGKQAVEAPALIPEPSPEPVVAVPQKVIAPKAELSGNAAAPASTSISSPPARRVATSTSPKPVASSLMREGALLLEARGMIESDPARALQLVHEHEKQFPQSQLAPERKTIADEASARLRP